MVLADRAGRAVTREELLAAVWPGVVVGDEVLTQCIIKLRRALGDNPRRPAYIETISKRGYRLIAPVNGATRDVAKRDEAAREPAPSWHVVALLAGVALTAIVTGAYLYGTRPLAAPALNEVQMAGDVDAQGLLTVTVLPFDTLSTGAGEAQLAGGIRSDLMTDLSRLASLRVIAASGIPARAATARMGRFIVSGSVQRESVTLRVNVRLVDSRTNDQLWSGRFERPARELLALQSEISRSLTEQLPGRISEAERRLVAKRYTHSLAAYEQFLRGQVQFQARNAEANLRARALYSRAIELDPKFARAYAGLAMTYAMDRRRSNTRQDAATLDRALALAESALQIDPDIPETHWARGLVLTRRRQFDEAIRSLHKAIALNPSYADAYALLGGIQTYIGEPAKSVPLLRTALRLNPDGGYLYYLILGRAYLYMDDLEQARINLEEALSRNAGDIESRLFLAATLVAQGNLGAAEWEADEIRAQEAGFSTRIWLETYPMTSQAFRDRLSSLVAEVGL